MELYPLKFSPISKHRIWGGNKLNTVLNKGFSSDNIGESWEISDVEGDETKVVNGKLAGKTLKELSKKYKDQLLGKQVYETFGTNFPLLIKFIDAKTPLSIQVHPNDAIAKERHNSFGKNEMWYVMNADTDAEIIIGFNKELDKKKYSEYLENNKILEVLNTVKTKVGEAFNVPTGRVHAIGAGVLLAEIQQTSDITYRIFDYNRTDKITGKQRDLHNDLALDVLDFEVHKEYASSYVLENNISNKLIHTAYFKSDISLITKKVKRNYADRDSFTIIICLEGSLILNALDVDYTLEKGETILIPSIISSLLMIPNLASKIIEVNV
jgi:mannose-6-phosphate isomerase